MTIEKHPSAPSVAPGLLERLRGLQVALISDQLHRNRGFAGLRPYHKPAPLAGTAVTVRTRAGDNLAILRAFEFCRPGDVMVVDADGDCANALVGGILTFYAASIGMAGMVLTARSATSPRSASGPSRSTPAATPTAAPTRTARARSTSRSPLGGMTVRPGRHRRRRPGWPARLRSRGGRGPDRQGHRPPGEGGADHRRHEGRPLGPLVHRRARRPRDQLSTGAMAFPLFDLTGRRALVTGSSQGIGLALAEGLAAHGAEVVLNGRDGAKLAAAADASRRPRVQGRDGALRRHRPGGGGRRCRGGARPTARSTSSSTTPACSSARPSRTFRSTSGSSS